MHAHALLHVNEEINKIVARQKVSVLLLIIRLPFRVVTIVVGLAHTRVKKEWHADEPNSTFFSSSEVWRLKVCYHQMVMVIMYMTT